MAENDERDGADVVPLRQQKRGEIIAEFGGPPDESSFTLAVYGENLVPSDVSKLLGVEPTKSFERGYRRRPTSRPMPHGAWFLEARTQRPGKPDELVRSVLMRLSVSEETWAELRTHYRAQLRMALHSSGFNQDFVLSSSTLQLIASAGLELIVDLYPPDGEDDGE